MSITSLLFHRYYDYLKRHPELTERTASALGFEQAVVTPAKVEDWFQALENFIKQEDPTLLDEPARWYNADESGFALCLKSKTVLAPKSCKTDKHLYLHTSSTKNQITSLCCMSATGHFYFTNDCVSWETFDRAPNRAFPGLLLLG